MTTDNFLLRHALAYRGQLLAVSLLTILSSLVVLAIPWVAGEFLGDILGSQAKSNTPAVFLLVAAIFVIAAITIVTRLVSARVSLRILADMRIETYAHVQSLPLPFHEQHRQGDLLTMLTFEVENLASFLSDTLARVPSMVLTAAGSVALLFVLDCRVALVIPVLVPLIFIALRLVGRRMRVIGAKTQEAEARLLSEAEKNLDMLAAIKSYAAEGHRRIAYASLVEDARALALRNERIVAFLSPVIALVCGLAVIAIILIARDAGGSEVDPQELFQILLYAALLTRPAGSLAGLYGRYQWAKGILARLKEVFAIAPEQPDVGHTPERASTGQLVFDNVEFSYPGREPVLRGGSLAIEPGETIALTGANGAGKSTLIKLALRFYEPSGGRILLDGEEVAGLSLRYLRCQFGYVPQRALLFNGTVRENILFGDPLADEARLESAINLSQAEDFIARLPQGLGTHIGDHGVQLSGGQGQRIALARALLLEPPILVLDEATSMFDLAGEEAFVASCEGAFADRSVILITHRPASLALADRIIGIDDGGCREISQEEAHTHFGIGPRL